MEDDEVTLERLAGGTGVFVSPRHRFGTDAMLLSAFCNVHRGWLACDLGTGCGIVPLRWHDAGHRGPCYGLELDAEGAALLARAASKDKALHVVEGANHMSLYDVPNYVDEAVSVLAPFFQSRLK